MTPSRPDLDFAIARACSNATPFGAAFAIGSYLSVNVAVEEFDFVVVLPEANRSHFPSVARHLSSAFSFLAPDVSICLASSFVPRSYRHQLTLHGAFYTDRELIERRPRILSALNEHTRIWGDPSLVPKFTSPRAPYVDLILGRWSLIHAMSIISAGGWSVPMWALHRDPPRIEDIEYRLSDPCVLVEFAWYFASKLTINLQSDALECESACAMMQLLEDLEAVRKMILATRRSGLPPDTRVVMSAWNGWVDSFQKLIETALAEDRSRLQAASAVSAESLVSGSVV